MSNFSKMQKKKNNKTKSNDRKKYSENNKYLHVISGSRILLRLLKASAVSKNKISNSQVVIH